MSVHTARTPFVGRADELWHLGELFAGTTAGRPAVALVQGDAGIGKTMLLRELVARAAGDGTLILAGAASADVDVPYLPLATAFAALPGDAGAHVFDDSAGPASHADVAATLLATVAHQSAIIAIDDLHWADPATLDALDHLVATTLLRAADRRASVLFLLASRTTGITERASAAIERLRRHPETTDIRLGALDAPAVRALIEAHTGAPPTAALLHDVVAATAGNPLRLDGLLADAEARGTVRIENGVLTAIGEPGRPHVTAELDRLFASRIDALDGEVRDLLSLAAVLGDNGSLADLEALAGLAGVAAADVPRVLDAAADAGLLDDDGATYAFAHPLLRDSLVDRMPARRRRRYHADIADALEARIGADGAAALTVVSHLRRAGPDTEPSRLARISLAAADHALSIGAWDEAARDYDAVLSLAGTVTLDVAPARLAANATKAHFRNLAVAPAERCGARAVELARASGDLEAWGDAILVLSRLRNNQGSAVVGRLLDPGPLEEFRAAVGSDDMAILSQVEEHLAEMHFNANDLDRAALHADAALDAANAADSDELLARAHFAAGLVRLGRLELPSAARAFRASMRSADASGDVIASGWDRNRLALVALLSGDLREASAALDEASRWNRAHDNWLEEAMTLSMRTSMLVIQGSIDDTEPAAASAERCFRLSEYGWTPALLFPALAAARATRGDAAGARAALDVWEEVGGRGVRPYRQLVDALSADVAAVAHLPRRADEASTLVSLAAVVARAEVAALTGDDDTLRAWAPELLRLVERKVVWTTGWPICIPRLAVEAACAAGDLAASTLALDRARAATDHALGSAPLEAGRVLLAEARLARAQGSDESVAVALIDAATQAFERHRAPTLVRHAIRQRAATASATATAAASYGRRYLLCTDIVGSTPLAERAGDRAWAEVVNQFDTTMREQLRRYGGVEFDHTGDGMSAWFTDAAGAVRCALSAAEAATGIAVPGTGGQCLRLRAGVVAGEPVVTASGLRGVSLALVTRVCNAAGDGGVAVTADVRADAHDELVEYNPRGRVTLKGLRDPVEMYTASWTHPQEAP